MAQLSMFDDQDATKVQAKEVAPPPVPIKLDGPKVPRPYQSRTVDELRKGVQAGHRNQILEAPTGSGKTFMSCMLMDGAIKKSKRCMFIAPRRELIMQTSDHLDEFGVLHGIIMAGQPLTLAAPVQVASKGTLASRTVRRKVMEIGEIDLLVIDECHECMADEYQKIIKKIKEKNPKLIIVGLTATPSRGDGRGLGDVYSRIVSSASYSELIEGGFLVPTDVFAPSVPNMTGVTQKDWDTEATQKMDRPKLIGNVYSEWRRINDEGRPTVIFASSIKHSVHLKDEFAKHGVRIAHLDAHTETDERAEILAELDAGILDVVTNCDVLSVGWDQPKVGCVVLAAPTRSIVKYRQRCGRALRPSPGKENCIIIDHSGAALMHGFPDEDIPWPLKETGSVERIYSQLREENKTPLQIVCDNCSHIYHGKPICPKCGSKKGRKGRNVAVKAGLLKKVKRGEAGTVLDTPTERQKYWHKCLAVAANRGSTCAAASAMFRDRFHEWPSDDMVNVPGKDQWQERAAHLFPNYVRKKKQ